jgi:hypothetical protein
VSDDGVVGRILAGDVSLFAGRTATHSLGWLRHPERYLGDWLDGTAAKLPRRHDRTLLLGMGGSSSPARLYGDWRPASQLTVLDTSNPDTIAATDFANVTVVASSKSGGTIETQTLLAHALASGLEARDLVIITDPASVLVELGRSLDAMVIEGDPDAGGRFSSLSPFGLVPALYEGWSPDELREELAGCRLNEELVSTSLEEARQSAANVRDRSALYWLGSDPITSGGALWMEQLVAETTGNAGGGFIPVPGGPLATYRPADMQRHHLVAALLARHLGVDPFNQPDVDAAKRSVFSLLQGPVPWSVHESDTSAMRDALANSAYNVLQVYAPLEEARNLAALRERVGAVYANTTANLGPRYLHSTGQLHKGGPAAVAAVQILQRPKSGPVRISGRHYTFHDLHMAQAASDFDAMAHAGRQVWQLMVDDLADAAQILIP